MESSLLLVHCIYIYLTFIFFFGLSLAAEA